MAGIVYMYPQKVRLNPIARTINFQVIIEIDEIGGGGSIRKQTVDQSSITVFQMLMELRFWRKEALTF